MLSVFFFWVLFDVAKSKDLGHELGAMRCKTLVPTLRVPWICMAFLWGCSSSKDTNQTLSKQGHKNIKFSTHLATAKVFHISD